MKWLEYRDQPTPQMKFRFTSGLQSNLLTNLQMRSRLSSTPILALPLLRPPYQSDVALLSGLGLAILLIVVLLVVIIILLVIIRRRSRLAQNSIASPPSPPVSATNGAAQTPTVQSPAPPTNRSDQEATVLSPPVRDRADTEPTLPSVPGVDTLPISGKRPGNITWSIAGMTDVGRKRKLNEDHLLMAEIGTEDMGPCGLYIVADGMGGHESGEVASRLTVETIYDHFKHHLPTVAYDPFEEWLHGMIMKANDVVIAQQRDNSEPKKMGSTLVMSFVADGQAHIANVGDSRAYHLTPEGIKQISVDHSLVERLIEIGQITREEARNHKQRNVVYSTIGDKAKMQIGYYHVDLQPGDRLLLCSDGLSGMLTDEQIFNISRDQSSPALACDTLIRAANASGGEDNITVIIIEMGDG